MSGAPMKNPAFVLKAPLEGTFEDIPMPTIRGLTELIIRINSTELFATDVCFWRNGPVFNGGHIPGQHAAGTIVMVGPGAKSLKLGDRVVFMPIYPCRVCFFCKSGSYNLCSTRRTIGIPPYNGTLSKFFVMPEDLCVRLPENLTLEQGALVGSFALAVHVCKQAEIKPGDSVVVFGGNTAAFLCASVARTFGATKIAMVGKKCHPYVEYSDTPQEIAKDIIERFSLGHGANTVIEASGAETYINAGIYVLKKGGIFVQTYSTMYGYERPIEFPITSICMKEIKVKGSCGCGPDDLRVAVDLLMSERLTMKDLSNVYEFEDAQSAFRDAQLEIRDANSVSLMADTSFLINGPRD